MKHSLLVLFIYFHIIPAAKQSINPDDLKFRGLDFKSKKELIWESPGMVEQKRIYHDCGFFSEVEQGKAFYKLSYPYITWVSNEGEGYLLNQLIFDQEGKIQLKYKGQDFIGKTTQKELEDLFNQKSEPINLSGRENENLEWIGSNFEKGDDGFHFYFKDGKLVEFEYWSTC